MVLEGQRQGGAQTLNHQLLELGSSGTSAPGLEPGAGCCEQVYWFSGRASWVLHCTELISPHPQSQCLCASCSGQFMLLDESVLHSLAHPRLPRFALCKIWHLSFPGWHRADWKSTFVSRDNKCPCFFHDMVSFSLKQSSHWVDFKDFSRISGSEQSCQVVIDCVSLAFWGCCTPRNPTHAHSRAIVALQHRNFWEALHLSDMHENGCCTAASWVWHLQQNLLDGQNAYVTNSWSITHHNAKAAKKHLIYHNCALSLLFKRRTMQ